MLLLVYLNAPRIFSVPSVFPQASRLFSIVAFEQ
jgi:hypothetical protein